MKSTPKPKPRGFAAMDEETKLRICSMGGCAVSQDRRRMSEIGRQGGLETQKGRRAMARALRKQGKT